MNVLCEHLMVLILRKIKIVRINMGIFSFPKAGITDKSQKYEIADYFLVASDNIIAQSIYLYEFVQIKPN